MAQSIRRSSRDPDDITDAYKWAETCENVSGGSPAPVTALESRTQVSVRVIRSWLCAEPNHRTTQPRVL